MNSMSEMHAEIAQRDRAMHERKTGSATLADELKRLEADLREIQTRLAGFRRKWGDTPPQFARERNVEGVVP